MSTEPAAWRAEIVDLVEDLGVVEGALQGVDGELVEKAQSLRWIERTRARLERLAEQISIPEEVHAS